MASIWADGAASVIVLPSGELGQRILQQAVAWTRAGLLDLALWVRPEQVPAEALRRSEVVAEVFSPLGSAKVDLLTELGRHSLRRTRLIGLRVVLQDATEDAVQVQALEGIDQLLREAAPQIPGNAPLLDFPRVVRINVIAAAPGVEGIVDPALVRVTWDWNLLLAMENRSTPFASDIRVRSTDEMVGVVLANVASIAGLWVGVPKSTTELVDAVDASSMLNRLWVHRTFVRGAIHQGLVSSVATDALRFAGDPDTDLYDPLEGMQPVGVAPVDEQQRAKMVPWLSRQTMRLGAGALSYTQAQPMQPVERSSVGIGAQLLEFLSFSWDKAVFLPILWIRTVAQLAGKRVEAEFQGPGGRLRIDATPRWLKGDKRDLQLFAEIESVRKSIQQEVRSGPPSRLTLDAVATPGLWSDVRRLLFAALDGSAGPESVTFPRTGNEDLPFVLRKVGDLFFDPEDVWTSPVPLSSIDPALKQAERLDWDNIGQASQHLEDLRSRQEAATKRLEEIAAVVDAAEEEPELEPDELLADDLTVDDGAEPSAPGAAGQDPAAAPAKPRPPALAGPVLEKLLAERETLSAHLHLLTMALDSMETWLQDRRETYVYALATDLAIEQRSGDADVAKAQEMLGSIRLPDGEALAGFSQRFVWRMHRRLLGPLLVGLGVWLVRDVLERLLPTLASPVPGRSPVLQYLLEVLVGERIWQFYALLAGVALILLVGAFKAYYRDWTNFAMEVKLAIRQLQYAAALKIEANREAARLRSLHTQCMSWLKAVATVLRSPWRLPDWLPVDPEVEINQEQLPLSVRFAMAESRDRAQRLALRRETLRQLVRPGWRSRAFEELVGSVGASLGLPKSEFSLERIDRDETRQLFLTLSGAMQETDALLTLGTTKYEDLVERVRDEVLTTLQLPMQSLQEDALAALLGNAVPKAQPAWEEFRAEIFGDGSVDQVPTISPQQVLTEQGLAETAVSRGNTHSIAIVPNTMTMSEQGIRVQGYEAQQRRIVDFTVRGDLVGPIDARVLKVFRQGVLPVGPSALLNPVPADSHPDDDDIDAI